MVVLVLADNLLLMYLGWEGVGLCSYLLIGFYYKDPANGAAAMKAFIVTRVGDVFLAFALFILYNELGTLNIRELMILAPQKLAVGDTAITWATLMLLGGAVGKSAQLPLQTWLADAMAGPTPVSALIHAATMVTAGVYLIARTHGLFLMAPEVLHLVGIVGAVTLLLAGFAALVQTDIKRVLAYSTMSQIGYMFLALGVQAWDAAIFHLMTHAFFKALLFLSSGSVILACHHEQNIFKMGGLRKSIPLVYVCFLVGGAALSALPLVTAGFFSKDEILAGAMANGHINLMVAGLVGAFMTSLYTFRMIFIVFHGEEKIKAHAGKGITHHLPLLVLLVLSTFVGAMIVPPLQGVLPETTELAHGSVLTLEITSGVVAIVGILLAAVLWLGKRSLVNSIANSAPGRFFSTWWFHAWGFDWLYDKVFVKPYLGIAKLLQRDPLNSLMNLPAVFSRWGNRGLTVSENGQVRWYIASMGVGAVVVLALLILV
jgi:NADH-quinone oxidoreductase subunit L